MSTSGDAERLSSAPTGVSLRTLIDAPRRLDELSTARLIGNVAEAVHKAQQGGQPLGLLSPLALAVEPDGSVAIDRTARPINAYGAPERLRGGSGDRRSDVFALGVILWESLAHERLFGGATDDEMKAAVLDFAVEFRAPSERNANVPAELDAICKKALARDPADRYQSAKVMAAEIGAVLDDAGYPDTDDKIVAYLAAEFPSGAQPKAPVVADTAPKGKPAAKVGTTTALGIAPVIEPRKGKKKGKQTPPKGESAVREVDDAWDRKSAPVVTPGESGTIPSIVKPPEPARVEVDPVVEPPAAAAPPKPIEPATPLPSATRPPATKLPSSPIPAITVPASIPPIAKADAPKPEPPKPELPPAPAPVPSALPAWAMARPGGTEPSAISATATLRGVEPTPAAVEPAPTAVEAAPFSPTATLPGVEPAPAAAAQPLVLGPIPGGTVEAAQPSAPLSTRTAILGSGAIPPLLPEPVVEPPPPDDAARLAAVRWHDTFPANPILPDPVPPPAARPGISNAETVPTPALAQDHTASQAGAMPATAADPAESQPHPASVVALPRAKSRGDQTKGDMLGGWGWGTDSHEAIYDDDYDDTARAGKRRLLFAIGGAAAAVLLVTVFAFAFSGSKDKDKAKEAAAPKAATWDQQQQEQQAAEAAKQAPAPLPVPEQAPTPAEPAPPTASAEPDTISPPVAEPPKTEPPKPEAAVAEPVKPEPATPPPAPAPEPPRTAKQEPPKAEPPEPVKVKPDPVLKIDPQKVAKQEPPKAEPPKVTKQEPPKAEPPKVTKQEPPKVAPPPPPKKVVARRVEKKASPPVPKAQPIDPYATPEKKPPAADPNAAYRTGFQQYVRGDSNGALATFKASLAANPTYAPTWRGIGLVYEKLGKKSQARTAYRRYLQLSPTAGDAEQIRERLDRLP